MANLEDLVHELAIALRQTESLDRLKLRRKSVRSSLSVAPVSLAPVSLAQAVHPISLPTVAAPTPLVRMSAQAQPNTPSPQLPPGLDEVKTLDELTLYLSGVKHPLTQGAQRFVMGQGNEHAHWLILGEAPGQKEDEQGLPFVGSSGRIIEHMIESCGFSRKHPEPERSVFITNSVFWRPPSNRAPTPSEIAFCRPLVFKILSLVRPRVILSLGSTAADCLGLEGPILKLRGQWRTIPPSPAWDGGANWMVSIHPSYGLRVPSSKRWLWQDCLNCMGKLYPSN